MVKGGVALIWSMWHEWKLTEQEEGTEALSAVPVLVKSPDTNFRAAEACIQNPDNQPGIFATANEGAGYCHPRCSCVEVWEH